MESAPAKESGFVDLAIDYATGCCIGARLLLGRLAQRRNGDEEAMDRLMPFVYDDLRRLAAHFMRRERAEHTLQTTALVNEAYLRLIGTNVQWKDRAHLFAVVARLMRREARPA